MQVRYQAAPRSDKRKDMFGKRRHSTVFLRNYNIKISPRFSD